MIAAVPTLDTAGESVSKGRTGGDTVDCNGGDTVNVLFMFTRRMGRSAYGDAVA